MSFCLQGVLPTIFQVNLGCLDILQFSSSICSKDNLFHGLDAFCITQTTVQTAKHRRELRTLTATRENHPLASFFLDLLLSSESTPLCLLSNTVTHNSAMNRKWCCWCMVKLSARIVLILDTKPPFLVLCFSSCTLPPSALSSLPFPSTITSMQTIPSCFSRFTRPTSIQASPICKMHFSKSLPGWLPIS